MTMIVVTHEMAFARDVSSHVVFMKDGVICEEGAPSQIFSAPSKDETKEFLSRFHGQISKAARPPIISEAGFFASKKAAAV
jgi:ABC-type methionine transport system ATPase subunit